MQTRSAYASVSGLRMDTVPFRLWEKGKRRFWNPSDLDFTTDVADWNGLTPDEQRYLSRLGTLFMVGEESVTLDILPLIGAVARQGRVEETMYLTQFAMEEAKHMELFRRWFDALGVGAEVEAELTPAYRKIFDDELPTVLRRLEGDDSPQAVLDAAVTYNQFVEGVLALTGYHSWGLALDRHDLMPAFREGLRGVQADERRHMAYGTYVCRRIVAAHPELWDFVEARMGELQQFAVDLIEEGREIFSEPYPFGDNPDETIVYALTQVPRRLEVIEVARHSRPEDIETDAAGEDLEAELEQV
jgi:ribonucleoside-diphosphate reductase beta chain